MNSNYTHRDCFLTHRQNLCEFNISGHNRRVNFPGDSLWLNAHRIILDGISFRGGQYDKVSTSKIEKK